MNIRDFLDNERARLSRLPTVSLIGLGKSNLALLGELSDYPLSLRSRDEIDRSGLSGRKCRIYTGVGYLEDITEDVLILSPSVRRDKKELISALSRGATLTSDAEIFFADSPRNIYGVTGSDGKSTTATIAAALLSERHPDARAVGNIGTPFHGCGGTLVAELSSFQLSYLKPTLEAAIITTLTPNHLNWHKSIEEYKEAKLGIFENAARRIASPDTELLASALSGIRLDVAYSTKYSREELCRRCDAEHFMTLKDGIILLNGEPFFDTRLAARREMHNIHNLMGAISLTLGECSPEHITHVAESFSGLEHRMQLFLSRGGVDYINSSIDTTPARTRETLSSLGRRVRIILGGSSKGLSPEPLFPALIQYAERISLYGEAGEEMYRALSAAGLSEIIECGLFSRFDEALLHSALDAMPGDTVLLSPAATGYGEFCNFAERGEHFMKFIQDLYR